MRFYPKIKPYDKFYFIPNKIDKIYVEQVGNPNGVPILFVHGGPGYGCRHQDRRFFDPNYYRVILIDQRGSGRSKPLGNLHENNIDNLISDFEQIRQLLKIKKWHIFGGSWGTTLSLAYAIKYPNVILSLILRGVCLLDKSDTNWWLYSTKTFFPDNYQLLIENIPRNKLNNLLDFYYDKLCNQSDLNIWHFKWFVYENNLAYHSYKKMEMDDETLKKNKKRIYGCSRIMTHYFKHCCPNILKQIADIREIPTLLIHGRYDMICPLINAWKVKEKLPNSQLIICENSGHASEEAEIKKELLMALERLKTTSSPLAF